MFGLNLGTLLNTAMPFARFDTLTWICYVGFNLIFMIWWIVTYAKKSLLTLPIYIFAQQIWMPICFMLPFAYSDLNFVTLGKYYYQSQPFIREAFLLGVLGTAFFPIGMLLGSRLKIGLPGLGFVFRSLERCWITPMGVAAGALICAGFILLFMALGFQAFNARGTAIADRSYLPIYNFFAIFAQFITLVTLAHIYITRSRLSIACLLVIGFCGVYTGARGTFLFTAMIFVVLLMIITRYKRIIPVIAGLSFFLLGAIYMGGWRHGEFGTASLARLPFLVFYGNNFSDLRDFALIISGWDRHLLWGKTFLAGFLTGLPVMPEFRDLYSWGKWSIETGFGFEIPGHPGLRGIFYDEWYFNFGIVGLCISGLIYGVIIERLSNFMESAMGSGDRRSAMIAAIAAQVYLMLIGNFLATAAFFTVHVIIAVVVFGYIAAVAIRKSIISGLHLPATP